MKWDFDWSNNPQAISFVQNTIFLCKPKNVHLCEGTKEEYASLCQLLVNQNKAIALKRPNSYLFFSDPEDVARVEGCTYICSKEERDAGPTNHWVQPKLMKKKLKDLFSGCMQGRTMYVLPYCMGPYGSDKAKVGIEITDSPYVVLSMAIMTRMGKRALQEFRGGFFVPGIHSVGVPLKKGEADVLWPCNPKNRLIVHFPEERSIWSFGSGYGGNALLGKKCFALRIASVLARDEGWLAEHMLILGITNPQGKKKYIAAAFPSSCGKTNLATMTSTLPGWKVELIGDDIAWMKFAKDGRFYAINPEYGMFGVMPGISMRDNPNIMHTISKNTLFTNVALTKDRDVWWEGLTEKPPLHLTSWLGERWIQGSKTPAAHLNARFTTPIRQCPNLDPAFENLDGVPISAILFGGRRSSTVPLVYQSFNWKHGVFLGASVSSERTAAAEGALGKLRHDPFSMLPFCGYNMGDYFAHWLKMGTKTSADKLPKIFYVNWFQKDTNGKFLWPGFGENIRVLQWIFERCDGEGSFEKTPIGFLPKTLNMQGLSANNLSKLLHVDIPLWKKEVQEMEEFFAVFEGDLPQGLVDELRELKKRICGS